MNDITLHHVAHSRSFRILWLLREMNLDCTIKPYKIMDGSLRTPEFLAISPGGRVPALEIDGKTLFESAAITEYLVENHPEHGLGRPLGHKERQDYLEWISYAETMASRIEALNLSWIFLHDPAMRSDTVCKIEARRLAATIEALERHLKDRDYVLTSGFSAADTMLGFNLIAAPYYVRLDPFPTVSAYVERISSRPAFIEARAQDGPQEFYTQDFYEVPRD